MDGIIQRLCDIANLDEIKKIPAIKLPIKEMIFYLENKIYEYDSVLELTNDSATLYMRFRSQDCLTYLKKVQ